MATAGTPPPNPPQQVQVTVTWHGVEDQHPAMAANAFLLQQTGQEFILSIGFASLPYFADPQDAAKMKTVAAKPIARITMAPGRVVELIQVLQQGMAQYQAQHKH
ncbi:MAG: hypothetical protein IVW54_20485 [Candidatus Binataceae bacterium]|nr:hypothetical protein [Candidatus Binataceae bacterium]